MTDWFFYKEFCVKCDYIITKLIKAVDKLVAYKITPIVIFPKKVMIINLVNLYFYISLFILDSKL